MRSNRAAGLVLLLASGAIQACGGARAVPESRIDPASCGLLREPSTEPGDVSCTLACGAPPLSARCEGAAGRPVSCACLGGPLHGHLFALDGCGSLTPATLAARCGRAGARP